MSFIKLDRKLLDSYSFANPVHLKIWLWILIRANFKTAFIPVNIGKGFITVEIKRGQFLFGRNKAEEELNINGSMIYRTLKTFEKLGQIKIEVNSHFSVITVCNYDTYQSRIEEDEQPMNRLRTGNEQAMNNTRTTLEQHLNINKEELEEKESKEEKEVIATNQNFTSNNLSNNLQNSNLFRQPNIPTIEEVKYQFIKSGGTEEMADAFFNKHSGTGWFLNGSPIVNYSSLISNFIINFNKFTKNEKSKSRTEQTNSTLSYLKRKGEELYREIERKKNLGDQS